MAWLDCSVDEFGPLARELLSQGHCVRLRVAGGSMEPLIQSGDQVEIEPAAMESVRVGDVVLFSLGGRLFLHRVVARRGVGGEARLQAHGDHNFRPEPEFGPEELLGVALALYRGEAMLDLRSPWIRWIGWAVARSQLVRRALFKLVRHWPGPFAFWPWRRHLARA